MNTLTNEAAEKLLMLPKKIIVDDEPQNRYMLKSGNRLSERFILRSIDGNHLFLLEISQGKRRLKITLHFQENTQFVGLLRVDYQGTHQNPVECNEFVPDFAKPYAKQDIKENHIHFHVQGYKPLAWAIPLRISKFPVKEIMDMDSFIGALEAFQRTIHLDTKFLYEGRLFL